MMTSLWQKNKTLFSIYSFILFSGLVLLITFPKGEIFLWINRNHSPWADRLFYYWTTLGNGFIFLVFFVILLFVKFRYSIVLLVGVIISSLSVNLMKQIIFENALRPLKYFANHPEIQLNFVEGVKVHGYHSFPSGHTTTAFLTFSLAALFTKKPYFSVLFMILATGVGVSRLYINQHFFMDAYAGSFIGFVTAVLCYWWIEERTPIFLQNKEWMDKRFRF